MKSEPRFALNYTYRWGAYKAVGREASRFHASGCAHPLRARTARRQRPFSRRIKSFLISVLRFSSKVVSEHPNAFLAEVPHSPSLNSWATSRQQVDKLLIDAFRLSAMACGYGRFTRRRRSIRSLHSSEVEAVAPNKSGNSFLMTKGVIGAPLRTIVSPRNGISFRVRSRSG